MRLFWREEEHDNPAWPGLVDLFAFTVVLLLLFITIEKAKVKTLAIEREEYKAQVVMLDAKVKELEAEFERWKPRPKPEDQTNVVPHEPVRIDEWIQRIHQSGIEHLKVIEEKLKRGQIPCSVSLDERRLELEINMLDRRLISFDTARWKLNQEDQQTVEQYAATLYESIKEEPVWLIINGRADPRYYFSHRPPNDNVDLSALRAAAVAKILENSAPGLVKKLQVVGLGAKEELVSDGSDQELTYRKYRSLSLVVRIDKDQILSQQANSSSQESVNEP